MTKEAKWITSVRDVDRGCVCQASKGSDLVGCKAKLSPPYFETDRSDIDLLCPTCALKHFGVTPPGSEAAKAECKDCGAAMCDCDAKVWSYMSRLPTPHFATWSGEPTTRSNAVGSRGWSRSAADYGPVQRVTEPPHQFDAPKLQGARVTSIAPDVVAAGLDAIRAQQNRALCRYAPCGRVGRLEHDGACSSLCADTEKRRLAIVKRHADFMPRTEGIALATLAPAIQSELAWAQKRTDEELEANAAQWRALRSES